MMINTRRSGVHSHIREIKLNPFRDERLNPRCPKRASFVEFQACQRALRLGCRSSKAVKGRPHPRPASLSISLLLPPSQLFFSNYTQTPSAAYQVNFRQAADFTFFSPAFVKPPTCIVKNNGSSISNTKQTIRHPGTNIGFSITSTVYTIFPNGLIQMVYMTGGRRRAIASKRTPVHKKLRTDSMCNLYILRRSLNSSTRRRPSRGSIRCLWAQTWPLQLLNSPHQVFNGKVT